MKIEILTIFPDIFVGFLTTSLIGKGIAKGTLEISTTDIRSFAKPPHMKVDDEPYGGGAGMVLKPEPLAAALREAKQRLPNARVVYLSPSGAPFTQTKAQEASESSELILVCGRYEGIDQRLLDLLVDEEWSIGDYVLMGGEVPAMAVIESITRLLPDILGNDQSVQQESFATPGDQPPLLEAPQYTRPAEFEGCVVPSVLTSGDHNKIKKWRSEQSLAKTARVRPDLLEKKHDN